MQMRVALQDTTAATSSAHILLAMLMAVMRSRRAMARCILHTLLHLPPRACLAQTKRLWTASMTFIQLAKNPLPPKPPTQKLSAFLTLRKTKNFFSKTHKWAKNLHMLLAKTLDIQPLRVWHTKTLIICAALQLAQEQRLTQCLSAVWANFNKFPLRQQTICTINLFAIWR